MSNDYTELLRRLDVAGFRDGYPATLEADAAAAIRALVERVRKAEAALIVTEDDNIPGLPPFMVEDMWKSPNKITLPQEPPPECLAAEAGLEDKPCS